MKRTLGHCFACAYLGVCLAIGSFAVGMTWAVMKICFSFGYHIVIPRGAL
jgi:hypothetical protein